MFIRVIKTENGQPGREMLLNIDHISKIEVEYSVKGEDGENWRTLPIDGIHDLDADRWFRVFVAGEQILLKADPNDPVRAVIDKIYKDSVKN